MTAQPRRPPRDEEEAAAFKGLGHAITVIRERRGVSRGAVAIEAGMTVVELEAVERGELDESWGGLRMIAKALDMPLPALLMEAEEFAPGKGGEKWRQSAKEAEADSTIPGARSDAAQAACRDEPP